MASSAGLLSVALPGVHPSSLIYTSAIEPCYLRGFHLEMRQGFERQ